MASAIEELNVHGVRGMTLGDISARLGLVSTGVIYYFKNKEELAEACFLAAIERYDALISTGLEGGAARDRLARFVSAYVEFKRKVARGEAERIAVFNDVRGLDSPLVNSAYVAMFRRARRLLDAPVGRRLPRTDRNARTHLLLSEMFWAVVWLKDFQIDDYGRAAERMATILCDELVLACFRRTFEIMWRAIRAAEVPGRSGLEVLSAICSSLITYQFGGAAPLLRTSALTTVPQALQAQLIVEFDRLSLRFASILCDGVADGSVRPVDVNVAAQMVTGMINAAAELHYWAPDLTAETAAEHYVRPLLQGLPQGA